MYNVYIYTYIQIYRYEDIDIDQIYRYTYTCILDIITCNVTCVHDVQILILCAFKFSAGHQIYILPKLHASKCHQLHLSINPAPATDTCAMPSGLVILPKNGLFEMDSQKQTKKIDSKNQFQQDKIMMQQWMLRVFHGFFRLPFGPSSDPSQVPPNLGRRPAGTVLPEHLESHPPQASGV